VLTVRNTLEELGREKVGSVWRREEVGHSSGFMGPARGRKCGPFREGVMRGEYKWEQVSKLLPTGVAIESW